MKRDERNRLAAEVFSGAWDRERNLPPSDRLEAAVASVLDVFIAAGGRETRYPAVLAQLDAAREPTVIDELAEARHQGISGPVAIEVARAHGLEVSGLMGRAATPEALVARDELCWRLSREKRMSQRAIGQVLAISQPVVGAGIKAHEQRMAGASAVTPGKEQVG